MMTQSRTLQASRRANQGAALAPNSPLNGQMQKPQAARARARGYLPGSAVVTAKSRPRHGAKAGLRKIAGVQRALAVKKRWVRAVAKRRTASLQPRHAVALRTGTAHRAVVRAVVVAVGMPVAATRAAAVTVHDSESQVQVAQAQARRVAHHAAVAATAATRLRVARASVAVTTAAALVAAGQATQGVAVATTAAARVAVKAATVAATKAAPARAHRARAGVIAANRRTDAAAGARAAAMVAAAARAATVTVAAVVAAFPATVGLHPRAAASAREAAQATVTA